jgi:cytochrome c-type biogenesis protein
MSGGVDTTVIAAFAVGFVSVHLAVRAAARAGLPVGVSGLSPDRDQGARALDAGGSCCRRSSSARPFTVVFVVLGMTATSIGSVLRDSRGTLDQGAGAVIIALGVFFVLTPFVDRLNREWRPESLISRAGSGGPLLAGAAFAVAWTPCVGPRWARS